MGNKDFTRLYSEHAKSLYSFLVYCTGDRALAEDLLADTFERVLRSRRGYDRRKATERTWLHAIALNCVRDNARRAATERRVLARVGADEAGESQFDVALDGLERREALHEALGTLPGPEREALALRFGGDLTLNDIAVLLGLPRSRVETRIYRGLKKLRECLGTEF